MAKKTKIEAKILGIQIACSGEKWTLVPMDHVYATSDNSPCDMCGEHGHVSLEFACPICNKYHIIEIKSW